MLSYNKICTATIYEYRDDPDNYEYKPPKYELTFYVEYDNFEASSNIAPAERVAQGRNGIIGRGGMNVGLKDLSDGYTRGAWLGFDELVIKNHVQVNLAGLFKDAHYRRFSIDGSGAIAEKQTGQYPTKPKKDNI